MSDYKVQQHFKHYISRLNSALKSIDNAELKKLVDVVQDSSNCNNTIFIAGNGGSAPTASHWSTDISKGVYYRSGKSIRTISLTDNVAWITAVANDIG